MVRDGRALLLIATPLCESALAKKDVIGEGEGLLEKYRPYGRLVSVQKHEQDNFFWWRGRKGGVEEPV